MVLIQRGEHGGYLALAERVVESIVDQLRRDSETHGSVAVVLNHGLQAPVLLVAAHVENEGNGPQLCHHLGGELIKIVQVVALQSELVLSVTLPAPNTQILRGLQEQSG